jgi:hypothetical protein
MHHLWDISGSFEKLFFLPLSSSFFLYAPEAAHKNSYHYAWK